MVFNVELETSEEGEFTVSVPALEGCFSEGDTEEEASEDIKEAISCYLEDL